MAAKIPAMSQCCLARKQLANMFHVTKDRQSHGRWRRFLPLEATLRRDALQHATPATGRSLPGLWRGCVKRRVIARRISREVACLELARGTPWIDSSAPLRAWKDVGIAGSSEGAEAYVHLTPCYSNVDPSHRLSNPTWRLCVR
jgi:hypothetical protein